MSCLCFGHNSDLSAGYYKSLGNLISLHKKFQITEYGQDESQLISYDIFTLSVQIIFSQYTHRHTHIYLSPHFLSLSELFNTNALK